MTITALINNVDFAPALSTWSVSKEISFDKVVRSLNGSERAFGKRTRTLVAFSLLPYTEDQCETYYNALLPGIVAVRFTDDDGKIKNKEMRVTSSLESLFLLDSIDGKRRYKGGKITLRQMGVD